MENGNDNERWLSDGNCLFCRRQNYCSKPCKAQKKRKAWIIAAMQGRREAKKEEKDG